jgi:hypothetical protein
MRPADHLLHAAAWMAIHLWSPPEAKRRVDAIASLLPPLKLAQARDVARCLRSGTCLSRSIALAARLPRAEVVIGARRKPGEPVIAHAWVECDGASIGFDEGATELARLR